MTLYRLVSVHILSEERSCYIFGLPRRLGLYISLKLWCPVTRLHGLVTQNCTIRNVDLKLQNNHSSCLPHAFVKIKSIDEGLYNVQKAYIKPCSKVTQAYAVLLCVGFKYDGKI
jgi:hypothetical protein